jgi:predicted ArsR family transcriptional regulator
MQRVDAIGAIAAIDDPVRRSLFDLVAAAPHPVSRDAAAEALAIPRSTAAFHLDRLAAAGLLTVEYLRLTGRTGPGSGRPSKLYRAADHEVAVSIPDRRYDLMGDLLASAITSAAQTGEPVLAALRSTARDAGRAAGAAAGAAGGDLDDVLEAGGYEPAADDAGVILANCPFHRLATEHTDVVCSANHAYLAGAGEATGTDSGRVVLDPGAGRCCVRILR